MMKMGASRRAPAVHAEQSAAHAGRVCSSCGRRDELVRVTVPADLSSTGFEREREFGIDACMAPIVAALQAAGMKMRGSCCGHGQRDGEILLADGRTLVITGAVRQ